MKTCDTNNVPLQIRSTNYIYVLHYEFHLTNESK